MSLLVRLKAELKAAMLAQDVTKRETLRMVLAAADNKRIELGRELADADVVAVIQKAVKSRQDSATQYRDAGRTELADQEEAAIRVPDAGRPKQLDEAEPRAAVEAVVAELGLASKGDMGRLMKELMGRHAGRVDGKLASRLAAEVLS